MPENTNEHHEKDIVTKKIEEIASKWREIAYTAVAILVVVSIYGIIVSQQEKAEKEAWKVTAQALQSDKSKDELGKVIKDYQGTEAVTYATLQLIKKHFDDNESTKARLLAKDFLNKHPDDYFAPQIRIEYGRLLEWEGKWEAAMQEYVKIKTGYLLADSMLGKARCLEQLNRLEEAKAEYKRIISTSNSQGWWQTTRNIKETASFRLAAIDNRELAASGKLAAPAPAEKKAEKKIEAVKAAVEEVKK
ncbi:MAG: tetratricopeptide repeat protein [Planctomycetota bacterium]|jgi:predicted negative regulator of RcsB-dependent stress response